jgi:hypothetical protein
VRDKVPSSNVGVRAAQLNLLAFSGDVPVAWVFQGNPKIFDIDDYVARYPELIYWRTPRHQSQITVGDRAIIWRAPLSAAATPVRTTLSDLAVLCANCHRAVHATTEVEDNYAILAQHFRGES